MYVYMKARGQFDNQEVVGKGAFECNVQLTMPREVFEEKLRKRQTIVMDNHVFKIHELDVIQYNDGQTSKNDFYILPIGAKVKKKTMLQKLKTLYFG